MQLAEGLLPGFQSPEFDDEFNAAAKRAIWPFVVGGILIVSMIGILPGIGFLIYGFRREAARKAARREAHLVYAEKEPILCVLVIGNRALFREKGSLAPALLVGGFGSQDHSTAEDALKVAAVFASLYGRNPAKVAPEHREACALVNDDEFQSGRRRAVPAHLSPNRKLWLFDTLLQGDSFDSGTIDSPFIPCLVSSGQGPIWQIPSDLAVFLPPKKNPNIIAHQAKAEAPPLVAPISENLEAIEAHISRHLGEPSTVYHELVSTTVHIDVHIVRATLARPWISLVTSGMSDIPMHPPEGAEAWRFAELMIRLPSNWNFENESLYGGPEFTTLVLPDGTPVSFWSLIPVYPSEMAFKVEHGSDALFERLAAAGYSDLFDPSRPPVV